MNNGGAFFGLHVTAYNDSSGGWPWFNNTFLGTGRFQSNTWGPVADHVATKAIDVTGGSSVDDAGLQLWTYGGGTNQQWKAVPEGDGHFHFVSRLSNKCLTVPNASTADSTQLVQLTCNGNSAQSFRLTAM
ncbi:ricin-type beta-trefoil lectin protein [Kribbella steppae]|uniref:Ricin-type beta-trefoil lectin protein n=1 Tax=Kribbella steppae TaxID=2512223 RepID=A0A4R2HJZ5_9ACTN|nr:RICIN domain-containing protein [Kribbella steppae]TCO30340.1 ricin-type beta-trefoil lectin protein [Kribbella steppae]